MNQTKAASELRERIVDELQGTALCTRRYNELREREKRLARFEQLLKLQEEFNTSPY